MAEEISGAQPTANLVWDATLGQWVRMTQPGGAGGPLTDTQLRTTPVPVSGPVTNTELRATPVPVTLPVDSTATAISTHDTDLDTGSALIQVLGSEGTPVSQAKTASELSGMAPLLVSDIDLQGVFGTQNLLSNQRLKVEDGYQEQIIQGILRTATAGMEVMFGCEGFNSLTIELTPAQASAWTGTVTFEASLGTQAWYAMNFMPNVVAAPASTATVSGIYRFNVSGFVRFRVRCSTAGTLNAFVLAKLSTAPGVSPLNSPVAGSQAVSLSQKATSFELNTFYTGVNPNTALLQNTLTPIEPWYTRTTYNIGDTVLWQGQVYRCIVGTSTALPSTVANWVVDERQNKSMATRDLVSPANATRLRVEVDLDDYQIRLAEETLTAIKLAMQNQTLAQEYELDLMQAGVSNGMYYGKCYIMGQSGMSPYALEEIR
jgi:hypothetical protein